MTEPSGRTPWWSSGEPPRDDARGGAGNGRARRQDPGRGDAQEHGHEHAHGHGHDPTSDAACQVCPICSLLRVLEDTRPELIAHLTEAARHLTLAAKAVIDAHAEHLQADGGLQHIPLDDE